LVASVAGAIRDDLASVANDIERVIVEAMPGLQGHDLSRPLRASIRENVAVALTSSSTALRPWVPAPATAVDYARRLAQRDVPATLLSRTYRVGQARFLEVCIDELLRQTSGEHLEGLATRQMIAIASAYLDHVVEQLLTTYSESRDAWVRDRSAVLAMRIRAVLRGDRVDVPATERALDYRFDRNHQALVLWVDKPEDDAHARFRHLVSGPGGTARLPGELPARPVR
jgi:hypothetical protein